MIKQLFNFRMPSIMGILLLLIGVGVTSYLVDQGIIFQGRAAPEKEPLSIAITNVSPTSFTVMYTTNEKLPGAVSYGTTKEGTNAAIDDRDQELGRSTDHRIHHITVRNLEANTKYYFTILSGDATFRNEGEPYTVTTAPALPGGTVSKQPITGKVTFPASTPSEETLVLLKSDTVQALSTLVAKDGSYSLPLKDLRTKDLVDEAVIKDTDLFDLFILSPETVSEVKVAAKNTHPIPLVLFGQSYDFTISNEPLPLTGSSASQSAKTTFPDTAQQTNDTPMITILSPEDQEKFTDQQPLFEGTALPGESIEVTITSETPVKETVKAGTDGSWSYRPKTPLAPGEQTITIRTKDLSGTFREFKRSFTVTAQGSSEFLEPSVSPVKTPTPTVSLSTPTPSLALSPTVVASATATPTITISSPTPTIIVITATPAPSRAPIDPTGPREIMFGVMISIGAVIGGLLLFFVTKGSTL